MPALRIVGDGVVLAAPDHHGRQEHVRLAVGLGLQIGDDGELADIVFGLAHDRLEQLVGDLHLGEVEIEELRRELLLFSAAVSG